MGNLLAHITIFIKTSFAVHQAQQVLRLHKQIMDTKNTLLMCKLKLDFKVDNHIQCTAKFGKIRIVATFNSSTITYSLLQNLYLQKYLCTHYLK